MSYVLSYVVAGPDTKERCMNAISDWFISLHLGRHVGAVYGCRFRREEGCVEELVEIYRP